jgi:peptide/nickel transport system permease protein
VNFLAALGRLLLGRLISGVALVFAMATLTFGMMSLVGGNVARNLLGPLATNQEAATEKARLGLNSPWVVQYAHWLAGAVHGDFGASWFTGVSVGASLRSELPITLSLSIGALVLTALLSLLFGVAAAVGPAWLDRGVQVLAVVAFAVPSFVVGLVLALVVALDLHLLPATGYVGLESSLAGWLQSVILPASALAIGSIAATAQQLRGSIKDTLRADYIRTLKSRGVTKRSLLFKHALRNALPPGLTVLSLQFIGMVSGTVVVEKVFGLNGIGTEAFNASVQGDRPIVMGVVVYIAIVIVAVNLAMDIAYGLLNPRVQR